MTTAAPVSFAGPPGLDPGWAQLTMGGNTFPPVIGLGGSVDVEVDEALKADQQKASGKDKAKTKINGIDLTKAKVTIEFTRGTWNAARSFVLAVSPNGPSKGGPHDVVWPDLNDRNCHSVIVTKVGKLERKPGGLAFKQTFDIEEWIDPGTASTAKGTDTPTKSTPWGDEHDHNGTSSDGGTFEPPAKGFAGPQAPSAGYKP